MDFVNENDIDFIVKMFDENFGKGYMDCEQIRHYINSPTDYFYAVRRDDGRIAGVLLYGEEDPEHLSEETEISQEELMELAGGKKTLKCRSMCIASDCQGMGVGVKLMEEALKDLRSKDIYGVITSDLWEYDGKIPAKSIHERNGYKLHHRRIKPWYNIEGYYCVVCGGRCECNGAQYVLKL